MPHDDRQRAAAQAAAWLADENALIFDTETTGLDGSAEIVQLAVTDMRGAVLLDALVSPTVPVSPGAAAIHGITDAHLALAAPIGAFLPALRALFKGRTVVVYNADYDTRLLRQSIAARGMDDFIIRPGGIDWTRDLDSAFGCRFVCAMRAYSQWVGEWNPRYKSYRWQRLPGGDHTALGDCRATLAVLRQMAGEVEE